MNTPQVEQQATRKPGDAELEMPKSTAAPLVLAFGLALTASGLVTNVWFSITGVVIAIVGIVGWIKQLHPGVGIVFEQRVAPELRPAEIKISTAGVEALREGMPGHRARIPERVHPYRAGFKGGIVGGIVMATSALIYGIVSGKGIWYPVNLLAAMAMPRFGEMPEARLVDFDLGALIVGLTIHVITSVIAGLFFGIILPTLPKWPIIWGGIVAPLLWTGWIYDSMAVLNPVMNERIDWPWFVVSQVAFGLSTGIVVVRSEKTYIRQVLAEDEKLSTEDIQGPSET